MKLAWLFLSLINAQDRESKLKSKLGGFLFYEVPGKIVNRIFELVKSCLWLVKPNFRVTYT